MRVYNIHYSETGTCTPLTVAPVSDVVRCARDWDAGLHGPAYSGDPPLKDAAEQARIILFAREMGWL